jgi:hypothetical protein
MKKVLLYVVSGLILLSVFSCGDKKATNLEELKKKYEGKEFKDCDKFIEAANEMMDVFYATIDKAAEGDEKAKKDIEEFGKFMDGFDKQAEKFEEECPDKFKAFEEAQEKKMEEYMDKILKMYAEDFDMEDMEEGMEEEWENVEMEENLTEGVE